MGSPDFRVGGRIFATLAAQEKGYGNLMLSPEQQAQFVEELPKFLSQFRAAGAAWARPTSCYPKLIRMCSLERCKPPGSSGKRRTQTPEKGRHNHLGKSKSREADRESPKREL